MSAADKDDMKTVRHFNLDYIRDQSEDILIETVVFWIFPLPDYGEQCVQTTL